MVAVERKRRETLYARVDPELKNATQRIADRYFDGNESTLLRDSVRLMVDLRDALGPRFELAIAELLGARQEDAS